MEPRKIIVGSRKSELALVQTRLLISFLQERFPNHVFEIKKISTCGDKILDVALSKIGDKNLFTKELEIALLAKEIDFVVHSLKDVPTSMPDGLVLGCICNRVSPHDVVLMSPQNRGKKLVDLPKNSVIGTSALRRIALLRKMYPDFNFQSIRGNLNTRLSKLDGTFQSSKNIPPIKYDAIILAKAGVERLGWENRIDEVLYDLPYAVSQGALACECRQGDIEILSLLSCIHNEQSALSAISERALMAKLEGGCCTPIAVKSYPDPSIERSEKISYLILSGTVMNLDGSREVKKSMAINLPFNCNFKISAGRKRPRRIFSDSSGYSSCSSSSGVEFSSGDNYAGRIDLVPNDYNASEISHTCDPNTIVMGVNVQPMCKTARLRMARAERLGFSIAQYLLNHGAGEILKETKQLAAEGNRINASEISDLIAKHNNSTCPNSELSGNGGDAYATACKIQNNNSIVR